METLGPYRIEDLLGEGAMGRVFRAHHTALSREVALKVLRPGYAADRHALARFTREMRIAASLKHPNLVAVFDGGEVGGTPYIATELVRGQSLEQLMRGRGALPWSEALPLARGLAEGLAYLHAQGIVHRDIKPSNVLVAAGPVALWTDFGLSRTEDSTRITGPGVRVGTLAFMPPEVASGADHDARGDLWSLGCVLYEMCSGRLPVTATDPQRFFAELVSARIPPLAELGAPLPPEQAALVMRLLSRDPGARPPAAEVAAALAGLPTAPLAITPPAARRGAHPRPTKERVTPVPATQRRTRSAGLGGAAGGAGLVGLAIAFALAPARVPPPAPSASASPAPASAPPSPRSLHPAERASIRGELERTLVAFDKRFQQRGELELALMPIAPQWAAASTIAAALAKADRADAAAFAALEARCLEGDGVAGEDVLLRARVTINRLRCWCLGERERALGERLRALGSPQDFEQNVDMAREFERAPLPASGVGLMQDALRQVAAGARVIAAGDPPLCAQAAFLAEVPHVAYFVDHQGWSAEVRARFVPDAMRLERELAGLPGACGAATGKLVLAIMRASAVRRRAPDAEIAHELASTLNVFESRTDCSRCVAELRQQLASRWFPPAVRSGVERK